jgi:hypothetical protein
VADSFAPPWEDDPDIGAEAEQLRLEAKAEGTRRSRAQANGHTEDEPIPFLQIHDAADIDPTKIPPRGWLLGNRYCRRFLSALIGDGGVGKTALIVAQALALATGRNLTGEYVFHRVNVLLVCLEDDLNEIQRRIAAAMLHHEIPTEDVRGRLRYCAHKGEKLLTKGPDGMLRLGMLSPMIRAAVEAHDIAVVAVDPLVKAHAVEENSNADMDAVADELVKIAEDLNVSIMLPHHVSKGTGPGIPGDANRGRGASSVKNAARLVYTLTGMSENERELFGIATKDVARLIRLDSGKTNLCPASIADWFEIVGVSIGNGTPDYPNGDTVQTVRPWTPPNMWNDINPAMANVILDAIDAGLPNGSRYSAAPQSKADRGAWNVVFDKVPRLTEKQAKEIIKTWVRNKVLESRDYQDPKTRKPVTGAYVNPANRPR